MAVAKVLRQPCIVKFMPCVFISLFSVFSLTGLEVELKIYLPPLILLAISRIFLPCVLSGIIALAPVLLLFSLKQRKSFCKFTFSHLKFLKSPYLCGLKSIKEKSSLFIKLIFEFNTAFISIFMPSSSSSKSSVISPL